MAVVALVVGYGASQINHTLVFARRSLGLSEGGMFTVLAVTRVLSLAGLGFAVVADRKGRRIPFLVAFALLPAANLLTALLPGVFSFAITQGVTRIAVIGVASIGIVILAEELTPGMRALGLGIYAVAFQMGTGFGLILLPIAEASPDAWRALFAISGVGLLFVPLLVRFLRESRAYVQYERRVKFRDALRAGLGRHFWPLAGVAFFIAAFSSPAFDFALERLIDDLGWDAGTARFLILVFGGLGATGLIVGGRFADVAGRRPVTITALLLGMAGGVGFYSVTTGWLLAPAILLASFGASMLTPSFAAHRSELFPTRVRATAAGWVTNAGILGTIAGFAFGALVVDQIGLQRTISLLSLGVIVAVLLMRRLPETKGLDLVRSRAAHADATKPASRAEPTSAR